jgi:hypothetical protein
MSMSIQLTFGSYGGPQIRTPLLFKTDNIVSSIKINNIVIYRLALNVLQLIEIIGIGNPHLGTPRP